MSPSYLEKDIPKDMQLLTKKTASFLMTSFRIDNLMDIFWKDMIAFCP